MTNEARQLLITLQKGDDRGAFAVACDGASRKPAHELESLGYARWRGTNWGSSFWSITDNGRAAIIVENVK